jgi:hypothetical protein
MPDLPGKSNFMSPLLVAAMGLGGAIVFGFAVPAGLINAYPKLTWDLYGAELFKASMTIAAGTVLGVVVAMLVESHRLRSARRAADQELRRALIAQLRDVHDQVKSAALLIKAHKSARTYGEQMRRLIEVRVQLLGVRRAITAERRPFRAGAEPLEAAIHTAAGYLEKLTTEYEHHYLRISKIQSYSYEWDQAQARKAAQSDAPPAPENMKSSTVPWNELTGPAFERLAALREANDDASQVHRAGFSDPLGTAIDLLRDLNEKEL